PALVVTVISCLLPPKSSTRAALPSGVRAGLSSVSSTTTLASLVASSAGDWSVPWAKAGTVKPTAITAARQRAEKVLKILLFFMGHVLLFGIGGSHRLARHHAAGQHGGKLLRGHTQGTHHLDDLQVLRLGFLRLQSLQLFLLLRDLLAGFLNFQVNALDFVLSHNQSLLFENLCHQFIRP